MRARSVEPAAPQRSANAANPARLAASQGVETLVAVGDLARAYVEGASGVPVTRWIPDATTAAAEAGELVEPGDCVLVKASRAVGLEAVAEALAAVNA